MTSITDIPIEDIKLFLSGKNISIPDNIDIMYDIAWNLIKQGKDIFYPDSL